ncbi:sulfotransferase family 2 domain-containing protein [Thalassotalea piscium]
MISHPHKCIFIHIPKVAGQSVESIFVELNHLTWAERAPLLLRPNSEPTQGPPRLAHLKATEYTQYGHISQETFDHYFKFTFVRNPWARLVSEYNYRKQHGDSDYQLPFKEFVLTCFPTKDKDDYSKAKDYYRHIIPQCEFIYDDNGNCLVDYIGRYESIQAGFNEVCRALSLDEMPLPYKNKTLKGVKLYKEKWLAMFGVNTHKKHYSQYYDTETQQFVADYYAKDIQLFDYKFERV